MSAKRFYLVVGIYTGLSVSAFLLFYPVLSGQAVSIEYVDTFLHWMPNWFLVAH